jgi:pimeloyl-ACP methyl ester carboxylesterase
MVGLDSRDLTAPDGTRLRRWGRVPSEASEAVLLVHGATYAGRAAFDPEGYSWLQAVADSGRAAYAVDLRGYGDSERPAALDGSPAEHGPVVRASTAARDVATALDSVQASVETVHLVGYSWGTIIAGLLLTERDRNVASLVQYAPVYRPPAGHRERFSPGNPPAAYRRVSKAEARDRWVEQRDTGSIPSEAFEAFWDALATSGQRIDDGEILAPNGTLADLQSAIDAPLYDAGAIDVPTLVLRGSLDTASTRADATGLYDALGGNDRTYTELSGGTHFLQLEPRRHTLYETVRSFQDRVRPA